MSKQLGIVAAVKKGGDYWRHHLDGFGQNPTLGKTTVFAAFPPTLSSDDRAYYDIWFYARHPDLSPRRCSAEVK